MTDLSKLSDDELRALYGQQQATQPAAPDLGKLSDQELLALHQQTAPKVSEPEPTVGEIAKDVAKSGGVGLARGAIGMAGAAGDLRNLLSAATGYVGDKLGVSPETAQRVKDFASTALKFNPVTNVMQMSPTSGDIQRRIEGVTGEFYQPKTVPGEFSQTIGSFAPAAIGGGSSALARVLGQVVAPAVASETLGQMTKGSEDEPYARIGGALIGSLGSGLISKLGNMAGSRMAASRAANALGGGATPSAVTRLAKDFEADALTPGAVVTRQAELGPEAMLLDMGRQLQGRGEALASQPGRSQNTILNAVEGRTGKFGSETAARTKGTLDDVMGPSPDVVATRNHINDVVDRVARPLYDKVMDSHPVVNVPENVTSRPVVQQAMKDAEQLAKNHGENITGTKETKTILSGPGYHIAEDVTNPAQTSLRYWDYVKKALDSRINGMMKSGGIQDLDSAGKADLAGLLDAKNALVGHLDAVTDGAYAAARKASATKFSVNEALDFGRTTLNTKLLPEELAEQMNNMSLPEREAVKAGMRREVDRIIDSARNDGAAARRVLDTNQNREKIGLVFGQDAVDAIDKRIAAETHYQTVTGNVAGNSRTSLRQELRKDTEAPSPAHAPSTTLVGLAHSALRRGQQQVSDLAMRRTREGMADLLTRRGDDIPTLARILSDYNAGQAARAARSAGPTSALARSLLAARAAAPRIYISPNRDQQQSGSVAP